MYRRFRRLCSLSYEYTLASPPNSWFCGPIRLFNPIFTLLTLTRIWRHVPPKHRQHSLHSRAAWTHNEYQNLKIRLPRTWFSRHKNILYSLIIVHYNTSRLFIMKSVMFCTMAITQHLNVSKMPTTIQNFRYSTWYLQVIMKFLEVQTWWNCPISLEGEVCTHRRNVLNNGI